jgi:hypothetical protein
MQVLETPLQLTLTFALIVGAVYGIWRGGPAERAAMIGLVLASLASPLVQNWSDGHATQWSIMAVDALYLAQLVWLTIRHARSWLPWAAAFQLLTTMTHVGMHLNIDLQGRGYIISSYLLFIGVLAAIIYGVARPGRASGERARAIGSDRRR